MKAHIGDDAESGLVRYVHGTAANVADVTEVAHLLHGTENVICADAGYTGVEKRAEHQGRPVIRRFAQHTAAEGLSPSSHCPGQMKRGNWVYRHRAIPTVLHVKHDDAITMPLQQRTCPFSPSQSGQLGPESPTKQQ